MVLKRVLSMVLVLCLLFISVPVFAADDNTRLRRMGFSSDIPMLEETTNIINEIQLPETINSEVLEQILMTLAEGETLNNESLHAIIDTLLGLVVALSIEPPTELETPEDEFNEPIGETEEDVFVFPAVGYALTSPTDEPLRDDDGSIPAIVTTLFGEYVPRKQTITAYLDDGTEVEYEEYVDGLAGLDFAWITSVGIFALILWSFFALLGGVLKRG